MRKGDESVFKFLLYPGIWEEAGPGEHDHFPMSELRSHVLFGNGRANQEGKTVGRRTPIRVCDRCMSPAIDTVKTNTDTWDVCYTHLQMIKDIMNPPLQKDKDNDEGRTPASA
jgi:hypothetical protein